MPELSVIIPFCNEYPQNLFTIQNVAQELLGRVDFEILAIDNYCKEVADQGRDRDKGGEAVEACAGHNPWLKYLKYEDKLSHWQAKNLGVAHSSGKYLWFCDAHCCLSRDALFNMFTCYKDHIGELDGTIHLPLTYKILEWRKLIYKLAADLETGDIKYSFTGFRESNRPYYQVPCMSTCGMMMTRSLYDDLGGWPVELGIYGGGENFLNFTLAILGKTVNIYPGGALFHHGEKRGYHWNGDDHVRNRTIANYMFGGPDLAARFIAHRPGKPEVLRSILEGVLNNQALQGQRRMIEVKKQIAIEDWIHKWRSEA